MGAGASASQENFQGIVMSLNDCPSVPARDTPTTAASSPDDKIIGRGMSVIIQSGAIHHNGHAIDDTVPAQSSSPPALLPHLRCLFISKLQNPSTLSMPVQQFWSLVENMFVHVLSESDLSRLEVCVGCFIL